MKFCEITKTLLLLKIKELYLYILRIATTTAQCLFSQIKKTNIHIYLDSLSINKTIKFNNVQNTKQNVDNQTAERLRSSCFPWHLEGCQWHPSKCTISYEDIRPMDSSAVGGYTGGLIMTGSLVTITGTF